MVKKIMPTKSNNIGGRGGARPGAGRKKSAVKDKAAAGNPGGRPLEILDIPEMEGVEITDLIWMFPDIV